MIRHLPLALTAALFCSVAQAQQGNLPAPVQKLSPYPPVVCVTPDWRPEPCEDRNASGWQCGNVKVTVSSKGNGDWSTEYLVTGIEKSNNRFTLRPKDELYLNGKLCTPFGEFGKTKLQAPPATTQLPEPVKCLKPDGTEEPCNPPPMFVLKRLPLLPPVEYDRPYIGDLQVRQVPESEVAKMCPPTSLPNKLGCSYPAPERGYCRIIMATDDEIYAAGLTPEVVWRHELGHCNGWGKDHKGARVP
jgi:hypothetical protein